MESVSVVEKGSKFRCQWLTHGSREVVANRLTKLAALCGVKVSAENCWMPKGFCQPKEALLNKVPDFILEADRKKLGNWWLGDGTGKMPTWDIASTCTIDGKDGLLLVEAKAHDKESPDPNKDKCNSTDAENLAQIGRAIQEANSNLTDQTKLQWELSPDRCYQMSNRFAWSWKLTKLGYPVILVYLGFLNATEMKKNGGLFASPDRWESYVKCYGQSGSHSRSVVPEKIWDTSWTVHGQRFVPCIRSCEIPYQTPMKDC